MKKILFLALLAICFSSVKAEDKNVASMSVTNSEITVASAVSAKQTVKVNINYKSTEEGPSVFATCISGPDLFIKSANMKAARGALIKTRVDPDDEESDYIYTYNSSFKTLSNKYSKLNGKNIFYCQCYDADGTAFSSTSAVAEIITITVPAGTADGKYDFVVDYEISNADGRFNDNDHRDFTFSLLVGDVTSGISEVQKSASDSESIFSANGQSFNKLQKGLNIVKTADGVKKVMVK